MISESRTSFRPDYAVPPGETLRETLEALSMTQAELAERAGRPKKTISEIIAGKAAITAETALHLERVLGVPASFWNSLERNYRETLARVKEEEQLRKEVEWVKDFPVAAMVKKGWLPHATSPVERLRAVLNFFGVAGVEEWKTRWESPQAAYRKSPAFQSSPAAVAAWLRRGELLAMQVQCGVYNASAFREALSRLRVLSMEPPEVFEPQIRTVCAEAGVAVVFVPEIGRTRAFGATRWLHPTKALIQLSLRGKSNDLLWFTFFHEAGHILLHGKRDVFIEGQDEGCQRAGNARNAEAEANAFACDFLIPPSDYRQFTQHGVFDPVSIRQFAKRLGLAPGIVVGRLQHDRLIPFSHGNGLKVRFQLITSGGR